MPEPAVADNATSLSSAIPSGGSGALELSDEDILGISPGDDSPAATSAAEPPAKPEDDAAPAPEAQAQPDATAPVE